MKGLATGSKPTRRKRASRKSVNAAPAKATSGHRAGTKRSDRRWVAPDGTIWASKFEYEVYERIYEWLPAGEWTIERCGPDCALSYSSSVKNGRCEKCGSDCVVQDRIYTPDLVLVHRVQEQEPRRVYIETKGYFEATKRNLFRQVIKAHPDTDIRLVAGADHWVTKGKSRLSDWAKRYKVKMYLWKDLQLEELLNG